MKVFSVIFSLYLVASCKAGKRRSAPDRSNKSKDHYVGDLASLWGSTTRSRDEPKDHDKDNKKDESSDSDQALLDSEECKPFMDRLNEEMEVMLKYGDTALTNYVCNPIVRNPMKERVHEMGKDVADGEERRLWHAEDEDADLLEDEDFADEEDVPSSPCKLAFERVMLPNNEGTLRALRSNKECRKEMKIEAAKVQEQRRELFAWSAALESTFSSSLSNTFKNLPLTVLAAAKAANVGTEVQCGDKKGEVKIGFAAKAPPKADNPCIGKKPGVPNIECVKEVWSNEGFGNIKTYPSNEQAAANVTRGYQGLRNTTHIPLLIPFYKAGLCPVNVHFHLGTEHYSLGQYDETGRGPSEIHHRRRLSGKVRQGFQCSLYDEKDPKFTTKYEWQHCQGMEVGQTYEVNWPHSAAGACGTVNQFQTPFLDGVFCIDNIITNTSTQIGVQAQVYTVVNDEAYYYPDLMHGMILDGKEMGTDLAIYTGSTTGTSVDNKICSPFSPITWQVDRKCHLISASAFDKMCADMKGQNDDMSDDLAPHGSRELVADQNAANNHNNRELVAGGNAANNHKSLRGY